MKLDQKFFVPFIAVCAAVSMLFIVLSSFNFKRQQEKDFTELTRDNKELLTQAHPYVGREDSLKLAELTGTPTVVFFWASWSGKSTEIMQEFDEFKYENPNINVVAALVKDATDEVDSILPEHDFIFIDGTVLFNAIRAPGIPSYLLLDEHGDLVSTHVGYKKGLLKQQLQ